MRRTAVESLNLVHLPQLGLQRMTNGRLLAADIRRAAAGARQKHARHEYLSHLEDNIAAITDDLGPNLDQFRRIATFRKAVVAQFAIEDDYSVSSYGHGRISNRSLNISFRLLAPRRDPCHWVANSAKEQFGGPTFCSKEFVLAKYRAIPA